MNDSMRKKWETALGVLKPSKGELDRGLELHRNSVVCDSYGFAPRAAIDGEALKAAVEAGASAGELRDMTEDMMLAGCAADARGRAEFLEAWEASGVTCILQNAGQEGQSPVRLMKRLAYFTYATDMLRDVCPKAVRPDDIEAAKARGIRCLYLAANGVPVRGEWESVEEELRFIRIFFQLGIRMMHLTYNRRNMIGDGCAEPANGGLSDFGHAAVAEMNRVGVIVDVAHSGWQTSLDAARASSRPMVASHSVCCAVNRHCRAKTDEIIRAIADTGGYIGICCVPAFLGGSGDIRALIEHVDYAARKFGADHVAIGTDRAYESPRMGEERAKVPKQGPSREGWEGFWPPNDPLFDPKWRQDAQQASLAWTNWPLFTVGLVQRGHSDDDIRKIVGGNVLRVARAVFPKG